MALLIMIYAGTMCLILGLHDTFPSMKRQNGAPVVKFAPFFYAVQTHEFSPFGVTSSSKRVNLSSSASKSTFLVEIALKKEATRKLQTIQGGARLNVIDRILILIGYEILDEMVFDVVRVYSCRNKCHVTF